MLLLYQWACLARPVVTVVYRVGSLVILFISPSCGTLDPPSPGNVSQ